MIQVVDRAASALVSALVDSGARSLVAAGVAAAALGAFRPRATSLRLFTWTAVLYASLALPLLGWVLPPLQISAPQFLREQISLTPHANTHNRQGKTPLESSSVTGSSEAKVSARSSLSLVAMKRSGGVLDVVSERPSFAGAAFSWNLVAAWIYVVVTLFFLARFAAGIVFSRKLVRGSRRITGALAGAKVISSARLATSDCISVPVTVGVFRPTILLPSDWREWEAEKLDAVLAHEFSHVARLDPLTQCMSLLYRAIFWFNPLAWWMNRHLAALAEQASDEAALSSGADQSHYARTLLGFFEVLQAAPRRIRWQGVAIARPGQAEQRLERILAWKGTVTMNVKKSLAVVIVVLAIPVIYLAASVHPAHTVLAASHVAMSQAPAAPAAPTAPSAPPVGGVSAVAPIGGIGAMAPSAPMAPMAPEAPMALLAPEAPATNGYGQSHSSGSGSGKGFSYAYGFDDEERFVISSGKSDSFTMSGSTQDARHVEKLKKQIPGDFIWFQRDEKSYIIRDQATIDRARGFWAGQEELGKKQEELGKQQEALGKQQEELGSKMEQVRVNVPDMTAALDKLKAKLQKLGPSATMEQIGDLQSEIGELQSKIGDIQSHAGDQQSKLGELQGELGEKQGKLGEEQGKLGEQQAAIAEKATRQMKELLDEAIKNGTAKAEEEIVKNPTL